MTNLLIRDVAPDVHAKLKGRAESRGQSLQQFLGQELGRLADRVTVDEVLARIGQHSGGSVGLAQAVDDVAAERSRE